MKFFVYIFLFVLVSFLITTFAPKEDNKTYSVIGDSYSNGEGVGKINSWPDQLVIKFKKQKTEIKLEENPSVTGWTSQQAVDNELQKVIGSNPKFVSIQLGVNDFVQGVGTKNFQNNLQIILDGLLKKVERKHIVMVTIPDFSLTPQGKQFGNPRELSNGVDEFNKTIQKVAKQNGVLFVDINPISKKVALDNTLTAPDGLHPSKKQLFLWTNKIFSVVATDWK